MNRMILDAVRGMLSSDGGTTAKDCAVYLKALALPAEQLRERLRDPIPAVAPATGRPPTRIIRRKETAELLSASERTIDQWAREGILRRVRPPGRKRAIGFDLRDIEQLIAGRADHGTR
jgi:excisionase family DNA binding protein